MPLDVVVPDLLLPPTAAVSLRQLRLPNVERWLARADVERTAAQGAEPWLAARFGLQAPLPVAAVTLAADDAPQPGVWLRADPVHLQVSMQAGALHDSGVLDVHRDEASALVATLQSHFAADALEFRAPHPERWYVRVPPAEMPRTTPLEAALGRNVFGLLPRGEGRINWPGAFTEVQMLFAAHEVNAQREATGRLPINSVWFWGEGTAPATLGAPYAVVYADDAFARGLARLSGTRVAEPPATPSLVDFVDEPHSVLLVLGALTPALRRGDEDAWTEAARGYDEAWFGEIPALLERFGTVRLVLPAHRETRMATLQPKARWRWFRGRAPLNDAHA